MDYLFLQVKPAMPAIFFDLSLTRLETRRVAKSFAEIGGFLAGGHFRYLAGMDPFM